MTIPALAEAIRCEGAMRDGSRCNKLLAVGVVVVGRLELACPKCGKRTVIASP